MSRVEIPAIDRRGEATALVGRGELRMRGAQMAVGAAVQFDQPVEDGIAGKPAPHGVFDIEVILPIRLAVAHDQPRQGRGRGRDAVQAIAGLVEPVVQCLQFGLERVGGVIDVDAQFDGAQQAGEGGAACLPLSRGVRP
ncbi:hypothetical protein [Cupriavidus sp. H18C1]|uniref:hypothetical protein n=1 Tax=Cupriavidus sp. H18C1 TaxID=3241601 RepID=UPI003BB8D9D3